MATRLDPSRVKDSQSEGVDLCRFSQVERHLRCSIRRNNLAATGDAVCQMFGGVLRIRAFRRPKVVRGAKPVQRAIDRLVVVLRARVDCFDLQMGSLCRVLLHAVVLDLVPNQILQKRHRFLPLNHRLEGSAIQNRDRLREPLRVSLRVARNGSQYVADLMRLLRLKCQQSAPEVALVV